MTLESHSRTSTSSTDLETQSREFQVRDAVLNHDISRLQELSLLPGGFGNGRKYAWPYLLGCSPSDFTGLSSLASSLDSLFRLDIIPPWRLETSSSLNLKPDDSANQIENPDSNPNPIEANSPSLNSSADLPPHPDEHQVELDTNRSFVLYPVVSSSLKHRKLLQLDLHDIILGVLRKRPKLRYFQGYHDIITVLFLTLPPEYVLPCAEKMSLHRLRDAMGNGLEPLVGQLRILKRLIKIVDPAYSAILTKIGHLPYYALSNLLTLFSHDMPTLPLIQHVFDWLLCREPAASIWLETVIILSKKDEILKLAQEEDDATGSIHATLTTLPPLTDEVADAEPSAAKIPSEKDDKTPLSESGSGSADLKNTQESKDDPDQSSSKEERSEDELKETSSLSESSPPIFPGEYTDNKINSTPLSNLLRRASDLFVQYPPSLPDLRVSQTFGSASILHMRLDAPDVGPTSSILPGLDDDQAESCVGSDEVMLPISQEEQDEELGITEDKEEQREEKLEREEKSTKEKKRRKFHARRRLVSRRQMLIAGTVLLIGVAAAMYGLQHPNTRNFGFGLGRNSNGKFMTENFRWLSTSIANLLGTAAKFGILI